MPSPPSRPSDCRINLASVSTVRLPRSRTRTRRHARSRPSRPCAPAPTHRHARRRPRPCAPAPAPPPAPAAMRAAMPQPFGILTQQPCPPAPARPNYPLARSAAMDQPRSPPPVGAHGASAPAAANNARDPQPWISPAHPHPRARSTFASAMDHPPQTSRMSTRSTPAAANNALQKSCPRRRIRLRHGSNPHSPSRIPRHPRLYPTPPTPLAPGPSRSSSIWRKQPHVLRGVRHLTTCAESTVKEDQAQGSPDASEEDGRGLPKSVGEEQPGEKFF
jgi:hypothetical protein